MSSNPDTDRDRERMKDNSRQRPTVQSMPDLDTEAPEVGGVWGGARERGRMRTRGEVDEFGYNETSLTATADRFEVVSFTEVDLSQQEEFQYLLKKESSLYRVFCHKGTIANIFFLVVMLLGIGLGEGLFPLEGVRGGGKIIVNDTDCLDNIGGCITVRLFRAFGLFGFIGGITNWLAVEMIFFRIPYIAGTDVIAKKYREIREGIQRIVVDTLFDPIALKDYFTDRKHTKGILHLEQQFASLLNSAVATNIIDRKIDVVLLGPEGLILTMMGVDHSELKSIIRRNVSCFLEDISPIVLNKMSSSITDGEGLQAEVEAILEQKIEDLSAKKVKQIVALIIRKHLSWLILWGNISGALIGILAEAITITAAKASGKF